MLSNCLKCKRNAESENSKVVRTKNGRIMVSSNCAVCGSKKSRFMKEQEAKRLQIIISKIPLIVPLLI